MNSIVVGVDLSPASISAWRWAIHLATLTNSRLVAVSAVEASPREVPGEPIDIIGGRVERELGRWVEEAQRRGVAARAVVRYEDPRRALRELADSEDAMVVVVGRGGSHGGPGLLHFGSVAEHLAHNLGRTLAVVPEGSVDHIRSLVVGVDGSASSAAAVAWCIPLAESGRVNVIAATVARPELGATLDERLEWRHCLKKVITDTWARPLVERSKGLTDMVEPRRDVADGLLALSRRHDAGVLVIGTRAIGRFSHRRAGGVSMAVLHGARHPIVLVPEVPVPAGLMSGVPA